jgi:hypothetical protein
MISPYYHSLKCNTIVSPPSPAAVAATEIEHQFCWTVLLDRSRTHSGREPVLPLKSTGNSITRLEHDRSAFVLHSIPELEKNAPILKINFLTRDVGRCCVAASSRISNIEACYVIDFAEL